MKNYFHCDTDIYKKRCKYAIILTAAPMFLVCIITMLALLLSFRSLSDTDYIIPLLCIIGGCILSVMAVSYVSYSLREKAIRRNSRYTFFDIEMRAFIFSRYAGEYSLRGEKTILRTVYVIPMKTFVSAQYDKKKHILSLKGDIREYMGDSETLGYHIKKGEPDFDRWWLNTNGFKQRNELIIPPIFGSQKNLLRAIKIAKRRFDNIPPPKPYKFREPDFVRRRPKARPMPEGMTFNRNW